jgi:xenotropic and polytropic retrovirus receptor 1
MLFTINRFSFLAWFVAADHAEDWQPALRMYRGTFLVILFIFLLGINTYGWRTSGVNHVLIFELDPRHHLTHQELLEVCILFSTLN